MATITAATANKTQRTFISTSVAFESMNLGVTIDVVLFWREKSGIAPSWDGARRVVTGTLDTGALQLCRLDRSHLEVAMRAETESLHFAYYNFCKIHQPLRATPSNGSWGHESALGSGNSGASNTNVCKPVSRVEGARSSDRNPIGNGWISFFRSEKLHAAFAASA